MTYRFSHLILTTTVQGKHYNVLLTVQGNVEEVTEFRQTEENRAKAQSPRFLTLENL